MGRKTYQHPSTAAMHAGIPFSRATHPMGCAEPFTSHHPHTHTPTVQHVIAVQVLQRRRDFL